MFRPSASLRRTLALFGPSAENMLLERRIATTATWLFTVSVLILSALTAARKTFWVDEIYTIFIAGQPTLSDLLASLREGCDQQAPLYALLAHALLAVVANQHLAVRLPAILGVGLMCPCIYYFLRNYTRPIYAFVAVLLTFHLVGAYAVEGRCYGLVLGLVALALLCFRIRREQGSGRKIALMGFFFATTLAVALQYFSVIFVLIAFCSQLLEGYKGKKADRWMLSACVLPLVALIPNLPFMEASKPFMAHYWARMDSLEPVWTFYSRLFPRLTQCLLFALSADIISLVLLRAAGVNSTSGRTPRIPASVLFLLLASALTPPLFGFVSLYTLKVFVSRYVLWALIAMCALLTLGIFRITKGNVLVAVAMAAALLYDYAITSAVALKDPPHLYESEYLRLALQYAPPLPRDIVIADHHAYLENWFYATPDMKDRLIHPISMELETLYTKKDTDPRLLSALRRRVTINTPDFVPFLASTPHFLLAVNMYTYEWMVGHLVRSGYALTPVFKGFDSMVYDVRRAR